MKRFKGKLRQKKKNKTKQNQKTLKFSRQIKFTIKKLVTLSEATEYVSFSRG